MVIFAVFTVFWLFLTIGTLLVQSCRPVTISTVMTVKRAKMTIGVPIIKNSQKAVKTAKMTITSLSRQVHTYSQLPTQ